VAKIAVPLHGADAVQDSQTLDFGTIGDFDNNGLASIKDFLPTPVLYQVARLEGL
jgi:hypothetical protein